MPTNPSPDILLARAEDPETVRNARSEARHEADLALEKARQNIRESYAAIKRADELLSKR
jgi:hypothetical protein